MRSSAVFLLAMVVAIQGASVPRDHAPSQIVEPYRPRIRAVDSRDPRQGQSAPRPLRPANKAGGPSPGPGGPASKSPDGPPGGSGDKSTSGSCPSVWKDVMAELKTTFMTGAICNDKARAAIRATFHDCGTWDLTQGKTGGCDGSLFVGTTPDEELARAENKGVGMQRIAVLIKDMAKKYNQSVADMIVFAGNAATLLCPGGPVVQTFVGRSDCTVSAPQSMLPGVNAGGAGLVENFARKGLNSVDLAALLGAHSTATQFVTDPSKFNASLDSTPGVWDVLYYAETLKYAKSKQKPAGVFVLASDIALAMFEEVGSAFADFANNQQGWNNAYAKAMAKVSLFGNDKSKLVDCTSALTS